MLQTFRGRAPMLHPDARAAESAVLVGAVTVEEKANIWYGAVLRGDCSTIRIGAGSNIQDNAVLHCDEGFPLDVGSDVTVGHAAVLHGCTVGDGTTVGMGAILLNGCVIGKNCLIAAGALVTQNAVIPDGSLVMGSPAKVKRPLTPEELEGLRHGAEEYRALAEELLPRAGK